MRIYINEFLKVWGKKSFLAIVAVLMILNGVLLYVNESSKENENFYSASDYKNLWADIEKLPEDKAFEEIKMQAEKLDFFSEFEFVQEGFSSEEEIKERFPNVDFDSAIKEYKSRRFLKYTNAVWCERELYSDVLQEMQQCENYSEYLQNIDDTAKKMTGISIFSKKGTFSYNNIEKTPDDFAHLKNNKLKFGISKGVTMATNFQATDLIALIIIFAGVMTLVTREKELNQMGLAKTAYKGRSHLAIAKLFAIFTTCIISVILLYAVNFSVAYKTYGFGDLDRFIQSVSGFVGSNLSITVGRYFVLFLLAKLFSYMMIASFIYFIAVKCKGSVSAYISLALILGIEGVLFYTIPSTSYLSMLKYINIFAFIDTYSLLSNYLNLNFFSLAVNYIPVFLISVSVLIIAFSTMSIMTFSRQKTVSSSRIKLPKFNLKPLGKHTNIFAHECCKIFIGGKVLPILLAFCAVTFYTYQPMKESFQSADDVYYKQYMMKLEGEYSASKQKSIDEEGQKFQQAQMEMSEELAKSDGSVFVSMKYQDVFAPQQAFEQVKVHAEYLKNTENGEFVYDSGYKLLTGDETAGSKDLQLGLIAMVVLICCLVYVYSVEFQTGSNVLLKCSYKGREDTFLIKMIISAIIVTVIFVLTYGPYFYNVLSTYATRGINAPSYSMEHLSNWNMSIKSYLIMICISRYVALLVAMLIVFWLSKKLKSFISTMLASTAILILPILLSLLGITFFNYILLNPLLIGNL